MAAENIDNTVNGTGLFPAKVPGLSDAADIQAALKLYHYGSYTYDGSNTNTTNLVNPSIAKHLQNLVDADAAEIVNRNAAITTHNAETTDVHGIPNTELLATISYVDSGIVNAINGATGEYPDLAGNAIDWNSVDERFDVEPRIANSGTIITKTESFTLSPDDVGKTAILYSSNPMTVTLPENASVEIPVGYSIDIIQTGTGSVTVVEGSGAVSINSKSSIKSLDGQYSKGTLVKIADNTWFFFGNLLNVVAPVAPVAPTPTPPAPTPPSPTPPSPTPPSPTPPSPTPPSPTPPSPTPPTTYNIYTYCDPVFDTMRGGAYGTQSAGSMVNVGTTTNSSLTSEQIVAQLGYGSGCPAVPVVTPGTVYVAYCIAGQPFVESYTVDASNILTTNINEACAVYTSLLANSNATSIDCSISSARTTPSCSGAPAPVAPTAPTPTAPTPVALECDYVDAPTYCLNVDANGYGDAYQQSWTSGCPDVSLGRSFCGVPTPTPTAPTPTAPTPTPESSLTYCPSLGYSVPISGYPGNCPGASPTPTPTAPTPVALDCQACVGYGTGITANPTYTYNCSDGCGTYTVCHTAIGCSNRNLSDCPGCVAAPTPTAPTPTAPVAPTPVALDCSPCDPALSGASCGTFGNGTLCWTPAGCPNRCDGDAPPSPAPVAPTAPTPTAPTPTPPSPTPPTPGGCVPGDLCNSVWVGECIDFYVYNDYCGCSYVSTMC
jgi:hypothetical protein